MRHWQWCGDCFLLRGCIGPNPNHSNALLDWIILHFSAIGRRNSTGTSSTCTVLWHSLQQSVRLEFPSVIGALQQLLCPTVRLDDSSFPERRKLMRTAIFQTIPRISIVKQHQSLAEQFNGIGLCCAQQIFQRDGPPILEKIIGFGCSNSNFAWSSSRSRGWHHCRGESEDGSCHEQQKVEEKIKTSHRFWHAFCIQRGRTI